MDVAIDVINNGFVMMVMIICAKLISFIASQKTYTHKSNTGFK